MKYQELTNLFKSQGQKKKKKRAYDFIIINENYHVFIRASGTMHTSTISFARNTSGFNIIILVFLTETLDNIIVFLLYS